jgi:SAM-dependent methyltransferase
MFGELHEKNRLSWNQATRAHNAHKLDQAAFLRQGGSTLFPEEIELLGRLDGKSLLHLQCNAGQDSLSLARLGARVTGVDISDAAIDFARQLSQDAGIGAEFHRQDVYQWLASSPSFDLVFSSYGALCWLSDLDLWAAGVARALVPGGRLVLVEFHPVFMCFEQDWTLHYSYFPTGVLEWESGVSDYVGPELAPSGFQECEPFHNQAPCYEFQWPLGTVLTAIARAGLRLERLDEYPYANGYRAFERMRDLGGRRFAPPSELPDLPLMYGLVASRAG